MLAWTSLLLVAVASAGPADSKADAAAADRVLARAVAAIGGETNIAALHSLVFRGTHYEGEYHQEYTDSQRSGAVMSRMRPAYRLVGCRPEIAACAGQWGRIVEGFDGDHGWELHWPKQRLVRTLGKAERALRCGAQFDPLFVDYRARGFHAAALGEQTVLGRRVIGVRIDPPACPSQIYYFDPATFLPVMDRLAIPLHARGDAVDSVRVIRESAWVQGVLIPTRTETLALADGRTLDGSVWREIVPNTLSDPALFTAPATHPVGITAIVLGMLEAAQTESPAQLLSRYARFRASAAGRTADTAYDLNWLGYELLKADAYPAALAVLGQAAAEHPHSADAQASLGDAYAQAGQTAAAAAAYRRALALRADDAATRRKLAELERAGP